MGREFGVDLFGDDVGVFWFDKSIATEKSTLSMAAVSLGIVKPEPELEGMVTTRDLHVWARACVGWHDGRISSPLYQWYCGAIWQW